MNKLKDLSPYEKIIMQRIRKIIDDYCDGSQSRFVERTGLNKGSVSQYVNGKNTPSRENAEKIAEAFHLDVGWVLGYDVIPDGIPEPVNELVDLYAQAGPDIQKAVMILLKSSRHDP